MHTRTLVVTRTQSGQTLAAVLRHALRCDWPAVRRLVRGGQVRLDGKPCTDPARALRRGQRLQFPDQPGAPAREGKAKRKPTHPERDRRTHRAGAEALPKPIIRHADQHIVVVDKPPGLTTVRHAEERAAFGKRAQRYLPPTLADLLPALVEKGKPGRHGRLRAVHRLDRETSGLLVFARTEEAERHLGRQMRAHSAGRKYLALVRGQPKSERIESYLVLDRGDGRRGSTTRPGEGKHAVTHVKVLEQLGDFALIECELETGRTHQVRIHLGERDTPLCGERIYDRPVHGPPLPDSSGAARPMLHAGFLQIEHPASGRRLSWTAPLAADMAALLKKLRRQDSRK
jgi:23S rRNA pseudouridine1911/1915/1917 synthase